MTEESTAINIRDGKPYTESEWGIWLDYKYIMKPHEPVLEFAIWQPNYPASEISEIPTKESEG